MSKATILSVDDDKNLQLVVRQYLEDDGYKVISAYSGKELLTKIKSANADVVLLDLVLPDAEGFSLISRIREQTRAAIIIVSGKSDTTEKIVGLELGADDYITKPFEMRELVARIKVVLRRHDTKAQDDKGADDKKRIKFAGWSLDRLQYQLFDDKGQSAELTTGEFKLLEALVMSANQVLSRDYLFELTREGELGVSDRTIDIQIARLRKKIGDDPKSPDLIKTVRGVGYMFTHSIKAGE